MAWVHTPFTPPRSCMSLGSILSRSPSSAELHRDLRGSKNITSVGFEMESEGVIQKRQGVS